MRFKLDRMDYPLLRVWCRDGSECAYVAFQVRGPAATVEFPSDWHEHRRVWVHLCPVLFTLAFSFPWRGKVPPDDGQCSGPQYGFAFRDTTFWVYTGKSTSSKHAWVTVDLPWAFAHVRHTWLNPDGSVNRDAAGVGDYTPPDETRFRYPYTYTRRNGEVQRRTATVNGEEREWRLRYAPWLPWPRKRQRSINVSFDDEVGERSGSWKGGTTGCDWDWRRGESLEGALRRMEREREL